jgi:dTDP-4-dehydrorhamnose 3,5-epimerase
MSIDFASLQLLPLTIVPRRHADNRGWLSETFHQRRLRDLGIVCRFIQDNQTWSRRKGTVRGFHFQAPPAAQMKLVSVVRGRILDVVVDIRNGSPTFGNYVSTELSSDNGEHLFVPIGFAHGFVSLEDDVSVVYKVSDYYAPTLEGGIRWNDPDIAFPWPFKDAVIISSEKDDRAPYLNDLKSPFTYDGNPMTILPTINLS